MINPSQVLELKARGLTQQAVALRLGCSERTVRTHWKPDADPVVAIVEPRTTLLGFEGIADDAVAGPHTEWLAWDGELRPVVPGMTGAAWKREQRALHQQHLDKLRKPAEVPLLLPAIEPEAATGCRSSSEELPVIAPTDYLYAPLATMSSEYEARMRLVKTFPRFEHPTAVHSRDLFVPKNPNWYSMLGIGVLIVILWFAFAGHHAPAPVSPLSGPFAPSVSLMR